jgi:cytochrome d ubiquinol oxidase subunit II
MDLNILWFVLITVLFIGFFFLEGFDYGVGILLPFLAHDDRERRMVINTIGPFWDGNEVWLITAGGAMFAAFPHWYASLFSALYIALILMLMALIVRGVAFEFRSKVEDPRWRRTWDWMLCLGSAIPALLWGVAMSNLLQGLPIDASMTYTGGFWNLLNGHALVSGLASLVIFALHGAVFLTIKLDDPLRSRAFDVAWRLWPIALVVGMFAVGGGYFVSDMYERLGIDPGVIPLSAGAAMLSAGWFIRKRRGGWAFILTGICIVFSTLTIFRGLYPRVLISSLNPDWSLTIYNAASSNYTLRTMSIIALIFLPVVLAYQGWSYYVFRGRISHESSLEY